MEIEAQRRMWRDIHHQSRRGRALYPPIAGDKPFIAWFPAIVKWEMGAGLHMVDDVLDLVLLPSLDAKSYRSMYAYGKHICVQGAKADFSTCNNGVAATFSQSYRVSRKDQNQREENLEYVGWVEEIIGVDYGKFELLLMYCKWVQANWNEAQATMKRDEYGFTLVKFDHIIPYLADLFAFLLHAQQVFFIDDVAHPG
jgi:hypothetical protein